MKMPRTRRPIPLRLVVVVILAVILVISVLGWQRWRATATESVAWRAGVGRLYQQAAVTSEAADPTARLAALRTLASQRESHPDCGGEWWYGWQADVLPPLRKLAERCAADVAAVTPVAETAGVLSEFLTQEAKLLPILASLTIDASQADWQTKAIAAAQQAETELARFQPPGSYKGIQTTALQQVRTISTRWRVLEEAAKQQDRKAYQEAVEELDNAYVALAVVGDTSDDELGRLLSEFYTAGTAL